ncbi:hypothetical protein T09_8083 [Trichinella sp. T9]|nr:hypothetical protein T09_8083 [Trichinella sp. T9]
MDPIQMMALVISVRLHTLLSCISQTNAYHCISLQGEKSRVAQNKANLFVAIILTSIFLQYSNDFGIKNVFIDKKNMESKVQSKRQNCEKVKIIA